MYSYSRATTHSSIPGPKPRLISWTTNLLAGFPGILVGPNHPITPTPNLPRSLIIYFPLHFPLIPFTTTSTSLFAFISPSRFSFFSFFLLLFHSLLSFPSWLSFSLLSLSFSFSPPYCLFLLCSVSLFSYSYFLVCLFIVLSFLTQFLPPLTLVFFFPSVPRRLFIPALQ
jgi:hypothetical protein